MIDEQQEKWNEKVKSEENNTPDTMGKKRDFKRVLIVLVAFVFVIGIALCILISTHVICLEHEYLEATCTEPQKCKYCGKTQGEPIEHTWKVATCTEPKTCEVCGKTEGDPSGHKWKEATCAAPKTCTVCGKTEGGTVAHKWKEATCTAPKTCSVCKKTEGSALGHKEGDWITVTEPTLSEPGKRQRKCERCGLTIDSESVYKDIEFSEGSFNFGSKEFISYMNGNMNSKYNFDWSQYKIIDNNGKDIYQVPLYKDGIYTYVTLALSEDGKGSVESFVMLGKDRALVTAFGALVAQKVDSGVDTEKVLAALALNKSDYTSHNTHFMFGKEGENYMLGIGYIGD